MANKLNNRTLRVLIAHSEPAQALGIEDALNNHSGFSARFTSDAREINPLCSKWQFDVLFLDMNMAHLPGSIVLTHFSKPIKEKKLAVVAMCTPDDFAMCERALILGAFNACPTNVSPADALGHARAAQTWMANTWMDSKNKYEEEPATETSISEITMASRHPF